MEELRMYSDDELKSELKRRAIERRKNTPKEIQYKEFEATVVKVENIRCSSRGKPKYKPLPSWRYKVGDWTTPLDIKYHNEFYLKQGCFNLKNAPKVGDRVKIRYRQTKNPYELHKVMSGKIVEVIN